MSNVRFTLFLTSVLFVVVTFYGLSPLSTNVISSWVEPPRVKSMGGLLDTSLTAEESEVLIQKKAYGSLLYDGEYPGKTLVVKPGDKLRIKLTNKLDQDTNLHLHGFHVSPKGHSDNVFVKIQPNASFQYEYTLPENLPSGLYWYHPHWHGLTDEQVMGGMLGAIIVKGQTDELPGIKGVPERLLVLTTKPSPDSNPNTPVRLVNGRRSPTLTIRPGEVQRWRIVNASADDFYNFSLSGLPFSIIARDGNTLSSPIEMRSELLASGDRIEILVKGPKWGEYPVLSLPFDEGFAHYPKDQFMTLESSGIPVIGMNIPESLTSFVDLRKETIDRKRRIVFTETAGDDPTFFINGQVFDSTQVGQTVTLGDLEEWTVVNDSDEWHTFHIHINPFQVVAVNGEPVERNGYDDTFGIGPNQSFVMRTRFSDFDGKFVMHCHLLFHEDNGMMQVVRVVDPKNPEASLVNSEFDQEHPHTMH